MSARLFRTAASAILSGLVWLLLLNMAEFCHAQDQITLGGHLKSLNLLIREPMVADQPQGEISSNRLRLDAQGPISDWGNWELALEQLLLYSDPPQLSPLPGDSVNRRIDLGKDWNRDARWSSRLEVDRCNLNWERSWGEMAVGRQAIGFGRISLSSPLDIIAPFAPDALDTEVRPGVDAVRLSYYHQQIGQLQGIVVLGRNNQHNSYLGTVVKSWSGIDLLLIGGELRDRPVLAGGLATSLGGMGIKTEISAYKGTKVDESNGDLHDDFAMAALEVDYRFDIDLWLTVEYLYNGIGTSQAKDYPEVWQSAPYQEGLGFLSGRNYLLVAASHQFHPLVDGGLLNIFNLQDDSWLLRPSLDFSLADNCVLQLFWTIVQGRSPRTITLANSTVSIPRSEFGSAAQSGGFFLKFFF